jgi:hypothetical protein
MSRDAGRSVSIRIDEYGVPAAFPKQITAVTFKVLHKRNTLQRVV